MPLIPIRFGPWHHFSAACKITIFFIPILSVICFFQFDSVFFAWLVAFGLLLSTWPGTEWWITRFLPLAGSLAFFSIWMPWTVPGDPIWPDLWYSPSMSGVGKALLLWLKGTTVAMGFLGLGRVCCSNEILATFQGIGIPPVFLCVIWITIQQTKRLLADWRRALQAHRARATPSKGAMEQTQFMAGVWAQMLIRSQMRTEDLVCSLQARGFSRRFHLLPQAKTISLMWIFPFVLALALLIVAVREYIFS